jgi:predicted amidohydrolase
MKDTKVTIASIRSVLAEPERNLERVRAACARAGHDGARLLLLPELMLTGHGGHRRMIDNAQAVPEGPLAREMLRLSGEHGLCICVGMAELDGTVVYNSQIVVDRGRWLGCQRKINLSGDEYQWFGNGESLPLFDIGDVRFGIVICYDNLFPEHALLHSLAGADLLLCPHAARTGEWPDPLTEEFQATKIREQQEHFRLVHRARAYDHNVFVLVSNAVGPSAAGLEGVVANHAGTLMALAPDGAVLAESTGRRIDEEIVTLPLEAARRRLNHPPGRNRRLATVARWFDERSRARAG